MRSETCCRQPASRDIHAVAQVIEEMRPDERASVSRELARRLGRALDSAAMSSEDVRALATAGFEIGFHTLGHARLPLLTDPELEGALRDGRERSPPPRASRSTCCLSTRRRG